MAPSGVHDSRQNLSPPNRYIHRLSNRSIFSLSTRRRSGERVGERCCLSRIPRTFVHPLNADEDYQGLAHTRFRVLPHPAGGLKSSETKPLVDRDEPGYSGLVRDKTITFSLNALSVYGPLPRFVTRTTNLWTQTDTKRHASPQALTGKFEPLEL
jgi:hypothetical protein